MSGISVKWSEIRSLCARMSKWLNVPGYRKRALLCVCVCNGCVCVCVESNLVAGWLSWTKFSDGGRQPLMIWKIVRPAVAVAQRSVDRNPTFTPNLAVRSKINWPVRAFLQNWG